ncbi:LytR cell envelope-related transcriptional attenuator [Georgenia satyanarayanai]|uniref:LytR cell envelope-related transcriptional attenuator n=1 Tax=Georgenia satyanarayanai TaxID=860221 RepID=A0A2Y9A4X7_9MICO|nr:LytR C-terminal domain-containing protein [Georgenia satyanarayanai]PYG01036.1 LytR cell envelope-related transcriptional attenuator [Georgenia satyanarayanai]SSA39275.1 LytR cell envelope-related transcriptional attenuator [Georgenia satyanarayanai]
MSQYPEDEFDVAGRDRGPQGVHREPRSLLRTLAPFLAVIVIVPLLAWGAVSLLGGGDAGPGADPAPVETTTESAEPSEEPTSEESTDEETSPEEPTSEEPGDEETTPEEETTEPDDDPVLTTSISVLNGAGINGLAGDVAAELGEAGFTTVGAADYGAGSPDVTTLYYRNADLAPTAEAVGELLGIDNLLEAPSATQNVEIAIVLRGDFAGR